MGDPDSDGLGGDVEILVDGPTSSPTEGEAPPFVLALVFEIDLEGKR